MKPGLLELLRCPACRSPLAEATGELRCVSCNARYRTENGVPDFTGDDGRSATASNFSRQWTLAREGSFERPGLTYNISDRALMRHVVGPFAAQGARTVLDAGCGAGTKIREAALLYPSITFIGLEIGAHVLALGEAAREIPNLHYIRGSLEALPVATEAFDLVICHGVLHHVRRQEVAFEEMLRVTRAGGSMSLWMYPACRDIRSPFIRGCFLLYYGIRLLFLDRPYLLGPRACRAVAWLIGAAVFPFLLVFVSPSTHRFLEKFEGEDYVPRTLHAKFRSVVFGTFDDLIPEIQTRYSLEQVRALGAKYHCRRVVTYADDSPLEFHQIPGFHLIEK